MRAFLRKWLGVEVVSTHTAVTKIEIQEMIGEALKQLIEANENDPSSYVGVYWTDRSIVYAKFNSIINSAVERKARTEAKFTTTSILTSEIQSEKFIDSIIERIKRKQLT